MCARKSLQKRRKSGAGERTRTADLLITKQLAATLNPLALFTRQMQMEAADRADTALTDVDRRIRTTLSDHQRPLRLL